MTINSEKLADIQPECVLYPSPGIELRHIDQGLSPDLKGKIMAMIKDISQDEESKSITADTGDEEAVTRLFADIKKVEE